MDPELYETLKSELDLAEAGARQAYQSADRLLSEISAKRSALNVLFGKSMPPKKNRGIFMAIRSIAKRGDPFRAKDIIGFPRVALHVAIASMANRHELIRLSNGVYQKTDRLKVETAKEQN